MRSVTWWITLIVLCVASVGLIAWDIVVATNKIKGDTISEIVQHFGRKHPFIPFASGVLVGHFFWGGNTSLLWWQQTLILVGCSLILFGVDLFHAKHPTAFLSFLSNYPIILVVIGIIIGRLVWPQQL